MHNLERLEWRELEHRGGTDRVQALQVPPDPRTLELDISCSTESQAHSVVCKALT